MKNELYYSSRALVPVHATHKPFWLRNIKFLFLLLFLSLFGISFYFSQNIKNDTIDTSQVKKSIIHEEPIPTSEAIEKKEKLTQDELKEIAHEIVKNLKSIEDEKKQREETFLKTNSYENTEEAIEPIESNTNISIESILEPSPLVTPSIEEENYKETLYTEEVIESIEEPIIPEPPKKKPIIKHKAIEQEYIEKNHISEENDIEKNDIQNEVIEKEYIQKSNILEENDIQNEIIEKEYIEESNVIKEDDMQNEIIKKEYIEEKNIEKNVIEALTTIEPIFILPKDILEELSIELNNVVETSFNTHKEKTSQEIKMLGKFKEENSTEGFLY